MACKAEGRCYYAKDLVQVIDIYRRQPTDNVIFGFSPQRQVVRLNL